MNSTINSTKTEYYHLLQFLNENKIPYVRMSIDTKTNKKSLRGIASGWNKWSYNKCMEYNTRCDPKCNAININLYKGQLVVVDVDNEDAVEEAFKNTAKHFGLNLVVGNFRIFISSVLNQIKTQQKSILKMV